MWDRCLVILVALTFFGTVQACLSEELSGKLERVDLETVTILGCDNQRFIMRVDQDHRNQAAPFLGKSVKVDFQSNEGKPRAIRFRSCE